MMERYEKYKYSGVEWIGQIPDADTSTIPQINNKHIAPFAVPYPLNEEQKAIVKHIKTETAHIDAKIEKIIVLQKEYRAALILEVVTGKIKVT